jgi:serine/threonine protein kinase
MRAAIFVREEASEPMLQVRQRLGDFEIIRLLGKGGMGEVYEAQQLNPPRRVALKVLAPWLAEDEEALQRFWREAAVPAQLDHPSIVRIISTDKTPDGIAYYTMQLVRGVSLAQLIQRASAAPDPSTVAQQTVSQALPAQETPSSAGPAVAITPLPIDESPPAVVRDYLENRYGVVIRIGILAARALAAAHRQGVLHRDIKPSNLMVDHHNHLYVVDFGLTRALVPDGMVSAAGAVRGTPWYMSPEQARGDAVDGCSDIYSLGVTLYELASLGLGPYTASRQNSEAILTQVKSGQTLPLRVFAADVPPALARIIERAMHFNPRRRYQSAEALAGDLEKLGQQPASLHTPSKGRPHVAGRFFKPVLLSSGLAVLVALLAALFFTPGWLSQSGKKADNQASDGGLSRNPSQKNALREHPLGGDSKPLPPELVKRSWNHPIALMKQNPVEPLWEYRLIGKGIYAAGRQMMLQAKPEDICTMVALDADPKRRWFEFAIELDQPDLLAAKKSPWAHRLGIFFGWQHYPEDPDRAHHFFVIELDERPVGPHKHGRLIIGTASYRPAKGSRQEQTNWFVPLPETKGVLPLSQSEVWHPLIVRVVDHKITVIVDGLRKTEFDLAWVKKQHAQAGHLDPRGALGVWAKEGVGWFRKATVTALPSDNSEK